MSLAGKYKIQLHDERNNQWLPSSPGIGMHVEVSTTNGSIYIIVNRTDAVVSMLVVSDPVTFQRDVSFTFKKHCLS